MSYFAGSLVIILCLISCALSAAVTLPFKSPTSTIFKGDILQKRPSLLKPDGRPLGTAGVLLYTYSNGTPYILLSRESDGTDKGTYSEFGGNLDLKADGTPETFQDACIRECDEESARLYKLTAEELSKGKIYFETTPKGREIVLCLVETKRVYQSSDLGAAQKLLEDSHFKEKDALLWIKAADLLKGQGIDPESKTLITLRPFFRELLQKPEFRKLIEELSDYQKIAA